MKKILLALLMMFIMMYGCGLKFMECGMFNTPFNRIVIIAGILGACFMGLKLSQKIDAEQKEHKKRLTEIKHRTDSIKLKDNGTDIDELIETLNDISIKNNNEIY